MSVTHKKIQMFFLLLERRAARIHTLTIRIYLRKLNDYQKLEVLKT